MRRRVYLKKVKRKGGTVYAARWFDSTGSERFRTLGRCAKMSKREADAKRREIEAELVSGKHVDAPATTYTIRSFREHLIELIATDVKPSTLDSYDLALRQIERVCGERIPVERIDSVTVASIKQSMKERGRSSATIRTTLASLKALWNRGIRLGLITDENPFAASRLPKPSTRRKRIFSVEEIEAMIAATPSLWWKALIRAAATTGLRKTELLMLMWNDLDREKNLLNVTQKRAGSFTVDGVQHPIFEWTPKGWHARTVPLTRGASECFAEWRKQADASPYVFISLRRLCYLADHQSKEGGVRHRVDLINNFSRDFKLIQQAAAKHLERDDWEIGCFHDLRSTYASRLVENGIPIDGVRRLLGHSSVVTTLNHYVNTADVGARVCELFDSAPSASASVAVQQEENGVESDCER